MPTTRAPSRPQRSANASAKGEANARRSPARPDPYEEAFLQIARTEAALREGLDRLLDAHGLSVTQYNVLRILRGAGPAGLCRHEIRDRLITRMPDVTRLLDRMEEAGWVRRTRSTEDRRLVHTELTASGRALVDALDAPVAAAHARQLGHLAPDELAELVTLLTRARERG